MLGKTMSHKNSIGLYYLLSKAKAGAGKKGMGMTEDSPLIWTKNPCIMQNAKNGKANLEGSWDMLDPGITSSFILVLSWH